MCHFALLRVCICGNSNNLRREIAGSEVKYRFNSDRYWLSNTPKNAAPFLISKDSIWACFIPHSLTNIHIIKHLPFLPAERWAMALQGSFICSSFITSKRWRASLYLPLVSCELSLLICSSFFSYCFLGGRRGIA